MVLFCLNLEIKVIKNISNLLTIFNSLYTLFTLNTITLKGIIYITVRSSSL